MLFAFVYSVVRLLLDVVDVRLRVRDPEAELLLLRHQLRVVRRQVKRPHLDGADRAIMAALSRRVSRAAWVGMLVQPETILAWHRELVRKKWAAFGRRRGPGRPGLDAEIRNLILRIAKENPKWGCVRIRGELLKLGHVVSASAIRKLLRRNRIGPAPLRSRLSWKAFLRAQASAIVLTDFLTVDTVFLKRLYEVIRAPIAAPKANAHMERQIGFDSARVLGLDLDPAKPIRRSRSRRQVGEDAEPERVGLHERDGQVLRVRGGGVGRLGPLQCREPEP